jgi:hypothetical protein
MTDIRADEPTPLDNDERLPWLEAVEEDTDQGGPPAGKLIAAVLIGLVAIGLIVGGLFWLGNRDGEGAGDAELIAAPQGDYKVKPDDPGGMAVEGEGDTAFAASAGADPKGSIDTNAVGEAPVARGTALAKAEPPRTPAGTAAVTSAAPKQAPPAATPAATPAPAPAPAAGGGTIQLGAFSSQAGANSAWTALARRFTYLSPLSHSVTATSSGGKTLYRLRASGPGAGGICGRLKVAGESCVVVD